MEQVSRTTLLCDDTIDGIFTAIYKAWEIGPGRTSVMVDDGGFMSMLPGHIRIETDIQLSVKVSQSIRNKISEEAYTMVYQAALSDKNGKAQCIYRFLQKGFRTGARIIDYLQDEDVRNVYEMSRYVWHESHKYMGFVRFEEVAGKVLVSKIAARANVIPLLADYFADRLSQENWIILDTDRNFAAIHRSGCIPLLFDNITEEQLSLIGGLSDKEKEFQDLWSCFYNTIAIEERKNLRQQMSVMPKRYRRYMTAENE